MRPARAVAFCAVIGVGLFATPSATSAPAPAAPRIALLAGHNLTRPPPNGWANVVTMDLDGNDPTQLTTSHDLRFSPALSPDGSRVAYAVSDDALRENLFVANADGSRKRNVTPGNHFDTTPSWSPDGRLIAFSSDQPGNPNYEIYTMRPDGTSKTRLTYEPGADIDPDWSPDGKRFVFVHDYALYSMDSDGSDVHELTACDPGECFAKDEPDWSSDGKRIVFVWDHDPHFELRIVNEDGTGERVLIDCVSPCQAVEDPAWSPDGSLIAFTYVNRGVARHAWVINADGTRPRPIPSGHLETCCVAWRGS